MKPQIKNKYIVVIPARGGSKSIKFKNIQTFNGIPLISFAVKKFKKFNLEVIVTSDSDEILNLASKVGAFCIKRPIELSGDNATSESAIIHELSLIQKLHYLRSTQLVFLCKMHQLLKLNLKFHQNLKSQLLLN